MRCLITGGAGFIGSHLAETLVQAGAEVRILDNLSKGSEANLVAVRSRVDFQTGDIQDPEAVGRAVRGMDYVFHLAALVAVPESVEDPRASVQHNDWGALTVFKAAAEAGVKRLVYSSSSAIYGDRPLPHHEDLQPWPQSPYAAHKLLGEHFGQVYQSLAGLEYVNLRYFNVYGPRQDHSSPYSGVVSIFLSQLRQGQTPTIFGDGEQTRDFVYVQEVARANLLAARCPQAAGRSFNIASGHSASINELYHLAARLAGHSELKPHYGPPWPGDLKYSTATVDRARDVLGFHSQTSLVKGLTVTWRWFTDSLAV